MQYKMYNKTQ